MFLLITEVGSGSRGRGFMEVLCTMCQFTCRYLRQICSTDCAAATLITNHLNCSCTHWCAHKHILPHTHRTNATTHRQNLTRNRLCYSTWLVIHKSRYCHEIWTWVRILHYCSKVWGQSFHFILLIDWLIDWNEYFLFNKAALTLIKSDSKDFKMLQ